MIIQVSTPAEGQIKLSDPVNGKTMVILTIEQAETLAQVLERIVEKSRSSPQES